MTAERRDPDLTDAQIRAIIDETLEQAFGGAAHAVARAALGTLFLVLVVSAATKFPSAEWALICAAFLLGLTAYIWWIARSTSARLRDRPSNASVPPAIDAPPVPPTAATDDRAGTCGTERSPEGRLVLRPAAPAPRPSIVKQP